MPGENQLQMDCQAVCRQQGKTGEASYLQQPNTVFLLELPHETQLTPPDTPLCDFAHSEHNDSIQSATNFFMFDSSTSKAFPLYISSSLYTSHSNFMNVSFSQIPVTENTLHSNSNPVTELVIPDVNTVVQSPNPSCPSEYILDHQGTVQFVVPSDEASPSAVNDQNLFECFLEHKENDNESGFPIFSEEKENALENADPSNHYTESYDMSLLLEPNLRTDTPEPSLFPIQEPFQKISSDFSILKNALSSDTFPKPCPALMPIEDHATMIELTLEATLLFSEQMRKHVQLITQMHLITAQQSALASVTEECRSMLQDLLPLKQRMEIANLDEALDLVTYWETIVTKTSPETLLQFERTVVTSGEKKKYFKRTSKHPDRCPFNSKMVELMAQSHVFIYPELLPRLAIFQSEPGPCKMSLHEEQLIAMGMEQFTPFCTELLKDDAKVSSKEKMVYSMISQYMLPHWTAVQIATRIKNKSFNNKRNKNECNPIKYYRKNKVAPPIHHDVQPFDPYSTVRLCDIPLPLLPERWQELMHPQVSKTSIAGSKRALETIASHQEPKTTTWCYQQDEAQLTKRRRILGELIAGSY